MSESINIPLFEAAEGEDKNDKARTFYLAELYAAIVICLFNDDGNTLDNAITAMYYECDRGDSMAKFYLGFALLHYFPEEESKEEGINLLVQALEAGADGFYLDAIDCIRLGMFIEQDEKKAAHLYRLLADKDDAEGTFRLAYCYECGIGVKKNAAKAEKLYKKADALGSLNAKSKITVDDVGQLHGGKTQKWKFRIRNAPLYVEI